MKQLYRFTLTGKDGKAVAEQLICLAPFYSQQAANKEASELESALRRVSRDRDNVPGSLAYLCGGKDVTVKAEVYHDA